MIIVQLQRKEENRDGLFGVLSFGGKSCLTLERCNKGNILPIREGVYNLESHAGTKYKNVVALVNEDLYVYHWPNPKARRAAILIHPANFQSQLKGCIALGQTKTMMEDNKMGRQVEAITKSIATVKEFMEFYNSCVKQGEHVRIEIRD